MASRLLVFSTIRDTPLFVKFSVLYSNNSSKFSKFQISSNLFKCTNFPNSLSFLWETKKRTTGFNIIFLWEFGMPVPNKQAILYQTLRNVISHELMSSQNEKQKKILNIWKVLTNCSLTCYFPKDWNHVTGPVISWMTTAITLHQVPSFIHIWLDVRWNIPINSI